MSVKNTKDFYKDKLVVALIEWYNIKVSFHFLISLVLCNFDMPRHLTSMHPGTDQVFTKYWWTEQIF